MMGPVLYQGIRLVFGTLYPAFKSFKAVKTKNVKEYVSWMTYWITFAVLTISEEVTDLLLSFWFPLYYEAKAVLLFWLLSPVTRGSSLLYRQVIHPALLTREPHIDALVADWKQQSYSVASRYTRVAAERLTRTVVETAIAGGGGLVETLRHSYSLTDLQDHQTRQEPGTSHEPITPETLPRVRLRGARGRLRHANRDTRDTRDTRDRLHATRQSGSLLALTMEPGEPAGPGAEPRRRAGSVRGRAARPSSLYGTLPRRTRAPRSPVQDLQPLVRRSTLSKDSIPLEESDSEGSAVKRKFSVSPVQKRVRKISATSSSKVGKEKNKFYKSSKSSNVRRSKEESQSKEEDLNLQDDNFSMNFSEEEVREGKKKCSVS